jgi:hypothetical protein
MHTHVDTDSDTLRCDGQKGANANVKRKDGQLTCHAMPYLKQETNFYVHPFESC